MRKKKRIDAAPGTHGWYWKRTNASVLAAAEGEEFAMSWVDSLVEATIDAFHFDRASSEMRIDVVCAGENKERKRIFATGINDFLIEDMQPYNIIDRVMVFGASEALDGASGCASTLLFLMQRRELTAADLEWPALKEKLALIRSGKLRLMEIEPVCGASVVILAESFRLEAG